MLGTERTIASGAYPAALAMLDGNARVHSLATPLLVSLAEEGWFDHPATEAAVRAYLQPWLAIPAVRDIDTLVLGCTHYPVFKAILHRVIAEITGHDVVLVDSAQAVTRRLRELLPAPAEPRTGRVELLATDAVDRFARVGGLFFPIGDASVQLIDL